MAKKKGGKGKGGGGDDNQEAERRDTFCKNFKAFCAEYKVQDELKADVEAAFSKDGPVTKMFLTQKHDSISMHALCDCIKGSRYDYLKSLVFLNCGFGDKVATNLAETLKYTNVECLELKDCEAGLGFSRALGEYLSSGRHAKLQKLAIDFNPIGTEGAKLISKGLANNLVLKELSLQYCDIDSKGGKYLGEMLWPLQDPENPGRPHPNPEMKKPLEVLNLCGNPLECAGVGMLAQGLARNRTLKALNLENTSFGANVLATQALSEACALCETLQSINIYGNLISNLGAEVLLKYMRCEHIVRKQVS
uniref:Uncharacterized protein n=1 Tax=Lotharella globosa TaxID=91324 RepID=A0A7S3ZD43_9EUKA